jgi:hypothetical protein
MALLTIAQGFFFFRTGFSGPFSTLTSSGEFGLLSLG